MLYWTRRIWNAIRTWWKQRRRRTVFHDVVRIESGADPASYVQGNRLVLVGSQDKPKWLRFACPCRCGETLALNLMTTHSPRWTVQAHDDGTITVHPSVDATSCGSHFWIRRSRIDWV